jgi:choline dehydrogenase-like flavoprotein
LTILSGANVGKVILSSGSSPKATGIEFRDEKGNTYTANGSREIIMALGSIKTPIILQQSGIGPSDVLSAAGVQLRVDLPVGLNLIDQTTTTTNWNFKDARGGGQPITWPRFTDLFKGADATRMRNSLQNDLGSYVSDALAAGAISQTGQAGLQKVLEIQRDWILNKGAGISENFDYTYDNVFGWDSWFLLPFGRGSIKITNNQPYGNGFSINPRYFANPFDKLAQGATARFTRQVVQASPLSSHITGETTPGGAVPNNGDLDAWATWTQKNYRSNWHPIGTAPMMSKNLGGVVDSNNKVYGVQGLRIVDASILPFQVSSHLMSVVYGLAERAADIIKKDNSGPPPTSSSSARPSSSSAPPITSRSSSTAPPAITGRALHPASAPSQCLDVVDGNFANGTPVQIWACNGNAQQKWVYTTGGFSTVKLAGTNFCLDATEANPADGTKLKIWTCIDRIPAQSWVFNGDKTVALQSAAKCMDLTDGNKGNGNRIQVWDCSSGNVNQQWTP